MKVDFSVGHLPQIEWRGDMAHVQGTEWKGRAVTFFVWVGDSNTAVATVHAESFQEGIETIKRDVVNELQTAIDTLLKIEMPPNFGSGPTPVVADADLSDMPFTGQETSYGCAWIAVDDN